VQGQTVVEVPHEEHVVALQGATQQYSRQGAATFESVPVLGRANKRDDVFTCAHTSKRRSPARTPPKISHTLSFRTAHFFGPSCAAKCAAMKATLVSSTVKEMHRPPLFGKTCRMPVFSAVFSTCVMDLSNVACANTTNCIW